MSGKFNGFTKDDIIKAKSRPLPAKVKTAGIKKLGSNAEMHKGTRQVVVDNNISDSSVNISQHPIQEILHFKPVDKASASRQNSEENDENNSILHLHNKLFERNNNCNDDDAEEEHSPANPFQGMSLKDFEDKRKVMEEQNRQKTDLLYKAIAHRSERTAEEMRRIAEVGDELKKLDNELVLDVAILRKRIDEASFKYMKIQKQYQQIESLFLKAKVDLFNAAEQKELLTEHLCKIIAHNEQRKSHRLTELMSKVGLEDDCENTQE